MKRMLSLLLAICLVLSLAACGKQEEQVQQSAEPEASQAETAQAVSYAATGYDMPVEADYMVRMLALDGRVYLCYAVVGEDDAYEYFVTSMNEDGSDVQTLVQAASISDIALDSKGVLWTLSGGGEEALSLNAYSGGQLSKTLPLTDVIDPKLNVGALNIDGNDHFCVTAYSESDTTVYVLDSNGALSYELEDSGIPLGTVTTAEGLVGFCPYDAAAAMAGSMNYSLKLMDSDAKAWRSGTITLGIPQGLFGGKSSSFYLNDTAKLYAYDVESGESEIVFDWLDVGLVANIAYVAELEDGRFAVVAGNYNATGTGLSYEYAIIGGADNSGGQAKQVLTLASLIPDSNVSLAVAEFNKTNPDYKIEVKTYLDYSDLTDEKNITDAMTQFNMDIISGNVPDIINMMYLSVDIYAAKGLLEDLNTYIDSDPEIKREDYFENLLDAMSIDGKLPYVTNGVYIYTMFGNTKTFGAEPGITAEALGGILDSNPGFSEPFGYGITKSTFLTYILYGNLDLIDWETGQCSFNTPEFVHLLELANRLPQEVGEAQDLAADSYLESSSQVAGGSQLGAIETILSVYQIAAYEQRLGDELNIVGLPVKEGVCHVVDAVSKIGISSMSQHKDAAWSFVRMMMDNDTQVNSMLLPISVSAFDELAKEAIDGNSVYQSYYENLEVTQADADSLKALVEATNYAASYDQVVMDIVEEESEAYFAGSTTAQDAAEKIQNRVQTYIDEQS